MPTYKINNTNNNEVRIKLNNMDYRYDVYQMVNLFSRFLEINFVEDKYDFKVDIYDYKLIICKNGYSKEYIYNSQYTKKEEIKKAIFSYFTDMTESVLPWGTLIGIRPSKRAMTLLEEGKTDEEIVKYFQETSFTREDKAKLCIEVARREMAFVNRDLKTISIYIGMPFCPSRCLYCSFASNPIGKCKDIVHSYLKAMIYEMECISNYIESKELNIECVYFGGGTPTSVNEEQFEEVMKAINDNFIAGKKVIEFTVECGRPDSITYNKLMTMKKYNVNRISINPQTMNNESLKLIGRNHTSEEVIRDFNLARELGFDAINMDIIVGLPGETSEHIDKTVEALLELKPDNLTVHGMSIKRASRLYENVINNQKYEIPEQEELNCMYDKTADLAKKLKMSPYYMYRQKNMVGNMENIGYSIEGKEGIYNIEMMEDKQTIIAIGADAVSKIVYPKNNKIERFGNVKDVKGYMDRIQEMVDKKIHLLDTLYNLESRE